jgi:hypothetical protein
MPMPEEKARGNTKTAPKPPQERPSDLGSVRVTLLADGETPTAALIEKRLRNVRQLFALSFMLRVPEVTGVELIPIAALLLSTNEDADLDGLVPIELQIRAAGIGSFWVDFLLQIPSHLPGGADLHQWTEWLKNAHGALLQIAGICGVLGTWLKTRAGKKASQDASPVTQIMTQIDKLAGVTEEQKEQIRRAIMRDLLTFEPTALQDPMKIPRHFLLKLRTEKNPSKK